MAIFFYNTDADSPRHEDGFEVLIAESIAATGGHRRYGDQLAPLSRGDRLLMYENRVGVVAVGTVDDDQWDGATHTEPLYYRSRAGKVLEKREYRRRVKWKRIRKAISLSELMRQTGYGGAPRGAVRRVVKSRSRMERFVNQLNRTKK